MAGPVQEGICVYAPTGAKSGDIGYCGQVCASDADCRNKTTPGIFCKKGNLPANQGFCTVGPVSDAGPDGPLLGGSDASADVGRDVARETGTD
jgi:hypothetical protein